MQLIFHEFDDIFSPIYLWLAELGVISFWHNWQDFICLGIVLRCVLEAEMLGVLSFSV